MFDVSFFFFNDTATTEIYTLSLHDALPISAFPRQAGLCARRAWLDARDCGAPRPRLTRPGCAQPIDRKSTRLNSSHANISYAVFCLKKKKKHLHLTNFMYTYTIMYSTALSS